MLFLLLIAINGIAQPDSKIRNYGLEEFNKIVTRGGVDFHIGYSDTYALSITTDNPCNELVNFSVSSKILYIHVDDSKSADCDLSIFIGVPVLNELVQTGGGDIVLNEGFSRADSFRCAIRGGGTIDVSKLHVKYFKASIEGGGRILLTAEKVLEGDVSGGGLIEFSGNPKVERNISGGGTIKRKKT